jgi:HEAT repeat protein
MAFHLVDQEQAVRQQIDRLRTANPTARLEASASLAAMGRRAAAATALTEALQDMDCRVRAAAALALGRIGPEAREAVPVLIPALQDESEAVRRAAAEALGNLEAAASAAMPALRLALRDRDRGVRKEVVTAVEKIERNVMAAILRAA